MEILKYSQTIVIKFMAQFRGSKNWIRISTGTVLYCPSLRTELMMNKRRYGCPSSVHEFSFTARNFIKPARTPAARKSKRSLSRTSSREYAVVARNNRRTDDALFVENESEMTLSSILSTLMNRYRTQSQRQR